MRTPTTALPLLLALSSLTAAQQPPDQLPPPPTTWSDFPVSTSPTSPGLLSAHSLIPTPAAQNGPVTVKGAHFYTGNERLRFWGTNFTFANCFPTHAQADATAARLRRFGINCVRFHHMDMFKFPAGIFADDELETLSPEALDRLDYFVAALKKNGVYTNLNLHVSRTWSRAHNWPATDDLESFDKMLDIFHPDLIAANKQYARDLLTHVNKYTGNTYAAEPAVAMVEINNEDSLFMWSAPQKLPALPAPYAAILRRQWNAWLAKKYPTRDALRTAWAKDLTPPGDNLLRDLKTWTREQHGAATMTAAFADDSPAVTLATNPDGTDWHLQFHQPGLAVRKGQSYTLRLTASADAPATIRASLGQAHDPWTVFDSADIKLAPDPREFAFAFSAPADDPNARLSFSLGPAPRTIRLAHVTLRQGGLQGLLDHEDPAKENIALYRESTTPITAGHSAAVPRAASPRAAPSPNTPPAILEGPARTADWFAFLQQTEESYFTDMRRFLKEDLRVQAPITGTIAFGPLGALSQSKMDFVDAHAYWDHPTFPRKPWDPKDWHISNTPMVRDPARATLWSLAASRVRGKPFTVTEYNHAAPNDWAAECVPMIATFAALQDWNGVFLFDQGHPEDRNQKIRGFFDVEGNPAKIALAPLGARLFLSGAVRPLSQERLVNFHIPALLHSSSARYHDAWPYVRDTFNVTPADLLSFRLSVDFTTFPRADALIRADNRLTWLPDQFALSDDRAAVYVGFPKSESITLGPVNVSVKSPFVTLILVPADPNQTLRTADRLLLSAIARVQNTGMEWDAARQSVSDRWGQPPTQIEVVEGKLSAPWKARPLTPDGATTSPASDEIGRTPAIAYELTR